MAGVLAVAAEAAGGVGAAGLGVGRAGGAGRLGGLFGHDGLLICLGRTLLGRLGSPVGLGAGYCSTLVLRRRWLGGIRAEPRARRGRRSGGSTAGAAGPCWMNETPVAVACPFNPGPYGGARAGPCGGALSAGPGRRGADRDDAERHAGRCTQSFSRWRRVAGRARGRFGWFGRGRCGSSMTRRHRSCWWRGMGCWCSTIGS